MEPFKNQFSANTTRQLGQAIKLAFPEFPMRRFLNGIEASLAPLELKPRMLHIANRIESCLPENPKILFPILVESLARDANDKTGLRGFLVWPLTEIVARRGLGHFRLSMASLREMTICFTAEFAIRPFLIQHQEKTLRQLHSWCADPNHHVRRLVSEGSRPFLPWGGNLKHLCQPPFPTLSLLEKLHRDESDYVRLSVSNHLNDLSKHHPDLVISTLARWLTAAPQDPHLKKLCRHACRSLVKQGHPAALSLLGFEKSDSIELLSVHLPNKQVCLGDSIPFQLVIRNTGRRSAQVMFDYAIHHQKANGTLSPKVFKGRVRTLESGESWEIQGNHPIRPITTRVYHPGVHRFQPLINGSPHQAVDFFLRLR